ncbi:hypothetical protein EDC01DRAFT_629585 [Geopyxis carbonaria]|nr:hypothetical protein EDC01DRAFT_629585 [Geopyxis carbonaria]
MSKCPDAQYCFDELIYPAMKEIEDMVDFKMSFIGTTTESGVACMHGPTECLGNMIHLCGAHLANPPVPSSYFGFSKCLLDDYSRVSNGEFVRECAESKGEGHGISFDAVNNCASDMTGDNGGLAMLQRSVDRSNEAGVRASCTVRLAGKVRCVRDGRRWRDCDGGSEVGDLVRDVKAAYGADRTDGVEL